MGRGELKSPSNKQIELANKMACILDLDFPRGDFEFTAYDYWKFINSHMEEYINYFENSNTADICEDDIWWGYDLGLWEF